MWASSNQAGQRTCVLAGTVHLSGPEDPEIPAPGQVFHYVVRAALPFAGGWGVDSEGVPRTPGCTVR